MWVEGLALHTVRPHLPALRVSDLILDSSLSAESLSPYTAWISAISDTDALLAEWDNSSVVTVDMGGRVRIWETGLERLQQSLMEWRNMIGQGIDGPVQVSLEFTFPLTK